MAIMSVVSLKIIGLWRTKKSAEIWNNRNDQTWKTDDIYLFGDRPSCKVEPNMTDDLSGSLLEQMRDLTRVSHIFFTSSKSV